MRKTLASIGALSLVALALSYCDKQGQIGVDPVGADLSDPNNPGVDLSTPGTTGDLATGPADMTEPPPPGPALEFTVVRIGTGAAVLTNDATAGFLERRKISDGTLVGNALALPIAVNGANKQLTFSGVATVEGQLSRSVNGKYLLVAGYAANPGVSNISSSDSTMYSRVIGRIDASNNINTSTTTNTAYPKAGVRGATSIDGNDLWISSEIGIGYTTLGSTALPAALSVIGMRSIDIFGTGNARQLYVSSQSSSGSSLQGVNSVGTGTPTTAGVTVTRLGGFTDTNSPTSVGFVAFDRDGNGAVDQLYVADDRVGGGGGVQRWRLNGATWMLEGTLSTGANTGARYVTGQLSGNTITILATTAENNVTQPRIIRLTDAGSTTGSATLMVLATAANNTTYRGIALAPQ